MKVITSYLAGAKTAKSRRHKVLTEAAAEIEDLTTGAAMIRGDETTIRLHAEGVIVFLTDQELEEVLGHYTRNKKFRDAAAGLPGRED